MAQVEIHRHNKSGNGTTVMVVQNLSPNIMTTIKSTVQTMQAVEFGLWVGMCGILTL